MNTQRLYMMDQEVILPLDEAIAMANRLINIADTRPPIPECLMDNAHLLFYKLLDNETLVAANIAHTMMTNSISVHGESKSAITALENIIRIRDRSGSDESDDVLHAKISDLLDQHHILLQVCYSVNAFECIQFHTQNVAWWKSICKYPQYSERIRDYEQLLKNAIAIRDLHGQCCKMRDDIRVIVTKRPPPAIARETLRSIIKVHEGILRMFSRSHRHIYLHSVVVSYYQVVDLAYKMLSNIVLDIESDKHPVDANDITVYAVQAKADQFIADVKACNSRYKNHRNQIMLRDEIRELVVQHKKGLASMRTAYVTACYDAVFTRYEVILAGAEELLTRLKESSIEDEQPLD